MELHICFTQVWDNQLQKGWDQIWLKADFRLIRQFI